MTAITILPGSNLARAVAKGQELHGLYVSQGLTDANARSLAASRACLQFNVSRAETLAALCRALDATARTGHHGALTSLRYGSL